MDHFLGEGHSIAFWASVQYLLTSTANISKSLWGQSGKLRVEREPLRRSLEVPDDSPLEATDLRNDLEHIDERLDRWYARSTSHNYIDANIGPAGSIVGIARANIFRHYDPATGVVTFWGRDYSIPAIVEALNTLRPIVERESMKPHTGT